MATNPQSATLRSPQAFIPGQKMTPVTPPEMKMPELPTLSDVPNLSRAPNAVGREWLSQRLANLPGKYNPLLTDARTWAKQALAGHGGWVWQDDDPKTAAREDLAVPTKDPSAALGAKETQAVWEQRYAANARGLLDSSFANKAVGSALLQLNEEAKATVNQYASNINQIIGAQRQETTDIIGDMVGLYGEDARWAVENPPPKPPDWMAPPGTVGDVWAGYHQPDAGELAAMYPGMDFTYRTDPDGRIVATARPKPPPPPPGPVSPEVAGAPAPQGVEPMPQKVGGKNFQGQWTGKQRPTPSDLVKLASAWGMNPYEVEMRRMGNGLWIVRPKESFKNPVRGAK